MPSTTPAPTASIVNGIDTATLMATVTAIKDTPALGACRFRARNRWLAGAHNRTSVDGFFGARQDIAHRQPFDMDADEPAILAGQDTAANPVEHLLHALASCLTTSLVAHAAVRGIALGAVESELEGDLDLRGFFGLDPSVPKGYTAIRVTFRVDAAPGDLPTLRELAGFSPVLNTLTAGTRVAVAIESK